MKVGIVGCQGRMGSTLVSLVEQDSELALSGGTVAPTEEVTTAANVFASNEEMIKASDVIIDFSSPEVSLENASLTSSNSTAHVIGTTGFTDEQFTQLKAYGANTKIVWGSNMSLGVNVLNLLAERAASALKGYDIEVLEMHHNQKKDAPSGTALTLGEFAAKGANIDLSQNKVASRDGIIGARKDNEIGFATLRGGTVVGEHKVIFAGQEERVELGHVATSREIFANGAIAAAKWLAEQSNGYYTMADVVASKVNV